MKSHEALQKVFGRHPVEHARNLHLSTSQIHKWQEPHTDFTDSGSLNPLDRIEAIVEKALSLGMPTDAAYAPIMFLAERFNLMVIEIPERNVCVSQVSKELLKTVKEFGDLASESSKALNDGEISSKEFDDIESEGWELINQICTFMQACKEAVR